MRHYYLLRNTLLGTAAATLAAAPSTAASVDGLLAAATSSSVSPPLHKSLRALSTTTAISSANIISPAYDRAMRHLQQESSNQDALDHCSGHTTAMITCLLTQCVGQQPCENDQDESTSSTEVAEGGVRDCKTVTAEVCGALDHSCCEPCSDHTKAYLDCFLDFEVSGTCPEASCTAGGADNGREISNSTSPTGSLSATKPNATNAEDATTGAGGKPSGTTQVPDNASAGNVTSATTDNANVTKGCDTVARDLKTCVDLNCAFRNCNDNPLGSGPGSIKICGSTTEEYCDAFEETQRCCPQCKELTTKSADCFLESIADSCPGAVCSGKNKNGVPPPNKRKAHLLEVSAAAATSWEHEQQEARSYSSSGNTPVAVAVPFLVAGFLIPFCGVL